MKLFLFLILSQSAFAKPLCEPSLTQTKSISDQAVNLAQLVNHQKSYPYEKEVNCATSINYAYDPQYYGSYGKRALQRGDTPLFVEKALAIPSLQGPGRIYLNKNYAMYVNLEHAQPGQDGGYITLKKDFNRPDRKATPGSTYISPMPKKDFIFEIVDDDATPAGYATQKAPIAITDKAEIAGYFRYAIIEAINEATKKRKLMGTSFNPDPKRLRAAFCDCMELDDEEIKAKTQSAADEEEIKLNCSLVT